MVRSAAVANHDAAHHHLHVRIGCQHIPQPACGAKSELIVVFIVRDCVLLLIQNLRQCNPGEIQPALNILISLPPFPLFQCSNYYGNNGIMGRMVKEIIRWRAAQLIR